MTMTTPAPSASPSSPTVQVPDSSLRSNLERTTSKDSALHVKIEEIPGLEKGPSIISFSNRDTETFKWQRARGVVGALEVNSEPLFKFKDDLVTRSMKGGEKVFEDALQAWEDLKLREEFIVACASFPEKTCCCGLLLNREGTKKEFVNLLNENWMKVANKKLLERGLKIDCFLWNWQNASGKAETNIVLIRFFELSSYRFRRASTDHELDFEIDEDEDTGDAAPAKKEMARS
jgi:hypothetical protein